MTPRLVWLSSYPKSGNTWLRALLSNYIKGNGGPVALHSLVGESAGSSRLFDEYSGLESSELTREQVLNLRPEIYRHLAGELTETRYLKVHEALRATIDGRPVYPPEVTLKSVYLIRHPGDVALSFASHFDTDLYNAVSTILNSSFTLTPCLFRGHLPQFVGDWSMNVSTWSRAAEMKVLVVRYEDLILDTEREFKRILEHLDLTIQPERLRQAVAHSAFSTLQEMEVHRGFGEKPRSSRTFFRVGQAGQWREHLPPQLRLKLWDSLGETMRKFDYSFDCD